MEIEELGIEVTWSGDWIEIRYQEGAQIEWTPEKERAVLDALGLKPWAWRLGAGRLVRASDGRLVEIVEIARREGE